ncbi:MAG: alpha-1,2-fucosyltransferase, partial [Luteolibacter sp.]
LFSDDPAWCREQFRGEDMETIDSGAAAANPLHDLHLMSLARHHIIANSSYSWWAAWLAGHANQHVIMPDQWYTRDIHAPMQEKRWK